MLRYQCTDTPLPGHVGKELGGALGQSDTGIGDDQPQALELPVLEMFEESALARPILLSSLADAENLLITRDVADLARYGT